MGVKVYGMELSAPVRCVMMTCEALKVEYEFIVVNLMAGEHMKPDYLKVCNEMISYQLVYLFEYRKISIWMSIILCLMIYLPDQSSAQYSSLS